MRKIWLALAMASISTVGFAAHAVAYPVGVRPTVMTNSATPPPGSTMVVTAKNFCPFTVVTFKRTWPVVMLGTAMTDINGMATLAPNPTAPTTPGTYTIIATAPDCLRPGFKSEARTYFTVPKVYPPGPSRERPQDVVGVGVDGAVQAGVALALVGIAVPIVHRQRRRARTAP